MHWEKTVSSINGAGETEVPYAEEWKNAKTNWNGSKT
jgi:hypothetical protein